MDTIEVLNHLAIRPGDLVEIVGPSKYGFNDRLGEVVVITEHRYECFVVPQRNGSNADLFPASSLKLVRFEPAKGEL